ncbi:MAG TPA: exosortase/archaeosortase family protein [Candidatus Spyradenecus faecavium]|uniref:Exosortase/archaeosortase family protein n=1 Tax=Candidatus Spyradenecus faecavium TaxID=2840947 RepID=A0A9D1NLX0_9BACT|nr:exosortase/archaeosortase family protein [Candidatus Spyradenecus faecavium]
MNSTNPFMRLRNHAVWRHVPLLAVAAMVLLLVDGSSVALPFEGWLAGHMASATRCVIAGFGADAALVGTVAPSCSGLRTAIAGAILGAFLARRRVLGAAVGFACGLGLNLVRLVAVEACFRVSLPFGRTVHDLALYLILLPVALLAGWLWHAARRPVRAALGTAALTLGLVLFAVDVPQPPQPARLLTEAQSRALSTVAVYATLKGMAPAKPEVDLTAFYLALPRKLMEATP